MQSLLITPKDKSELDLLSALLARLDIPTTMVGEEDQEDIGMGLLMQEAERGETTTRESIFKALGQA